MKRTVVDTLKTLGLICSSPFLALPWLFFFIVIYLLGIATELPGANDPFRARMGHVGYSVYVAFLQASMQVGLSAAVMVAHWFISFPAMLVAAVCCVVGVPRLTRAASLACFLTLGGVGLLYWAIFFTGAYLGWWVPIVIDA